MKYNVKVKTNKKENKVDILAGVIYCDLTERAEDNKANFELIKLLKKHFGKNIRIVKGLKNKNKVIEVLDHA